MADAVDSKAVKAAFKKRKSEILASLETLTLKSLRKQIERDMGLQEDALKPHKLLLSDLIDKVIAQAAKVEAPEEQPAKKQCAEKTSKPDQHGKSAKPGPRQFGKDVEKLRGICRQATIPIPPSLYVKNKSDAELALALEALLSKHDLSSSSGPRDVARVQQALQVHRDLDGIDTSNIVVGGRRRQPAQGRYCAMAGATSDAEDSQDGGDDASSDNESDGAPGSASAGEGGSVDDDMASPSKASAPKVAAGGGNKRGQQQADSPNENVAPQGQKKRGAIIDWSDDE